MSSNGKFVIIIKHHLSINEEINCREEEIIENSIHLSFLSTDLPIDEYIDYIKSHKIRHIIVSDGKKILQLETENNSFFISLLESGLYLFAYKKEDVLYYFYIIIIYRLIIFYIIMMDGY